MGFKKLIVLKDFSSDVVTHMIDDDTPNIENNSFKKNEILNVDVLDEDDSFYREIQFDDGSMIFQIPKKLLKELKTK